MKRITAAVVVGLRIAVSHRQLAIRLIRTAPRALMSSRLTIRQWIQTERDKLADDDVLKFFGPTVNEQDMEFITHRLLSHGDLAQIKAIAEVSGFDASEVAHSYLPGDGEGYFLRGF